MRATRGKRQAAVSSIVDGIPITLSRADFTGPSRKCYCNVGTALVVRLDPATLPHLIGRESVQSTRWNHRIWNERYNWSRGGGDEWSSKWGTPEKQWYGAILPRIAEYLPTGRCLEIAPGFGRWTQFLLQLSDEVIAVDLCENCVEACQQRFAGNDRFKVFANDGKSLEMVPDHSIDFAFSFDSLVHVELDVLDAYLSQLKRKLTPQGVGFFHHSIIGSYTGRFWHRKVPLVRTIMKGILPKSQTATSNRAFSVTAERFRELASGVGLHCVSQELVNWSSPLLIDSLSIFTADASAATTPCKVKRNPQFMADAQRIRDECELEELASAARAMLADTKRVA
jgi:SAM-dependent methyltransferase